MSDNPPQKAPKTKTQATFLAELADKLASFYHAPDGRVFANILFKDGHRENVSMRTRAFRCWLSLIYYEKTQNVPGNRAVEDALNLLRSKAEQGPAYSVYIRVGGADGVLYIDLGCPQWRAIKVTPDGWEMVSDPPVRFFRSKSTGKLPEPQRGGRLAELNNYLNVREGDLPLVYAWLLGAYAPRGPYPLLALYGQQGSAKTTLARVLKALTDPDSSPVRAEPRDIRDLHIYAFHTWVLAMDNISSIHDWMSDSLCRLSTGGAYSTRMLYSDDEEMLFEAMRPAIINGVVETVTRPDLLERTIALELPGLPEDNRKTEQQFWSEFAQDAPYIFGSLLDVLAAILKNYDTVKLDKLPRMADFIQWVSAAEQPLELPSGYFAQAFRENQNSAVEDILSTDDLADVLSEFLDNKQGSWQGRAIDLLPLLNAHPYYLGYKTPADLSKRIKRLAPALVVIGIQVRFERTNKRRLIVLQK